MLFRFGIEFCQQLQLLGQQFRLLGVVQIAVDSIIFIEDHIAGLAAVQVDDPGKQADLVVGVQVLPQAMGKIADGAGAGKALFL